MQVWINKFSAKSIVTTKNLYPQLRCGAAPWNALVAGVWTMPGGWPAGEDTVVTPPSCSSLSSPAGGPGTLLHSSASCRESVTWPDLILLSLLLELLFSTSCFVWFMLFFMLFIEHSVDSANFVLPSVFFMLFSFFFLLFFSLLSVFFTALFCQLWTAIFVISFDSFHITKFCFFVLLRNPLICWVCALCCTSSVDSVFKDTFCSNCYEFILLLQMSHFDITSLVICQLW